MGNITVRLNFFNEENISREKLLEIEKEIKSIIGEEPDRIRLRHLCADKRHTLEDLFEKRRWILNNLFEDSTVNIERIKMLNSYLRHLSSKLHERVNIMAKKAYLICDDPTFDDDYEIEGVLSYNYNGEESVLDLDDDDYYESDFKLMICTIDSIYYDWEDRYHEILTILPGNKSMDDGMNWNESPILYPEIDICYATHELVCHKLYSLPDLIRLNDFWAEVKFIEQSITEQNGKRWISTKLD